MKFPQGISVLAFVVLCGDKVVRKFRSTQGDLPKFFVTKNGSPVIGPNVYRELTLKEIAEKNGVDQKIAKRIKSESYAQTLVPVCNIQPATA